MSIVLPSLKDIETFVIEQGNPEVLILDAADWQVVYDCYRATNRDEQGVFVLVINTKIYSVVPQEKAIDLSAMKIWATEERKA